MTGSLGQLAEVRKPGALPVLLVLLILLRVATAAAVECQHALAETARAADRAQEARRIDAIELGGVLCLDGAAGTQSSLADDTRDRGVPHLDTPCPFFNSPVLLADAVIDPVTRPVVHDRLVAILADQRRAGRLSRTPYNPRAPPRTTGMIGLRA